MAIFWTSDDLRPVRRGPRPPRSFGEEFAGWIDGELVERVAAAIRACLRRLPAAVTRRRVS